MMVYLVEIVAVVGVFLLIALCMLQRVGRFRMQLLDIIELTPGDHKRLMAEFRTIDFGKMVWSLRSPASFYEGTELLRLWRERRKGMSA